MEYVLHVGAEQTTLERSGLEASPQLLTLDLGWRRTAAEHFRRDPPTEADIENAIQAVEDEVMRVAPLVGEGAVMVSPDPAFKQIALLAGVPEGARMTVTIDAMERLFDRLASVVTGTPAASAGIPPGPAFAATLLILRECMHHLKIGSLVVSPG